MFRLSGKNKPSRHWSQKSSLAYSNITPNKLYQPSENYYTKRALVAAGIFIGLVFIILLGRLWFLQLLQGEAFRFRSENNRIRTLDLPPPRGIIFDAKGRILADNQASFSLALIPEDVRDWELLARRLHTLAGINPEEITELQRLAKGASAFKPVRLRSNLDYTAMLLLETFRYELPGVTVLTEHRRNYPENEAMCHAIGYLAEINAQELQEPSRRGVYRQGDYLGRDGIERSWEEVLRGTRGYRQVEREANGRELGLIDEQPALPGNNIILTLDLDLQKAAARAMGDEVGAVVAMNPQTGEILCLYSSPSYNLNQFGAIWQDLLRNEYHPLKNRAINGIYPPGSTYKIVMAAAGLAEKEVDANTTFHCSGEFTFGNHTFRCWRRGGHGSLNLRQALKYSCDVYFYRLGLKLGVERIAKYARAFGLGDATGIALPHEAQGLVPDPAWKMRRDGEPWLEGDTVPLAIGQGANVTTPLQLVRMVSVIASKGLVVTPTIIKAVVPPGSGEVIAEPPALAYRIPVSSEHLELIHRGLVAVVNEPGGTAGRVRLPGVTVAAKTGTSQVVSLTRARSYGSKANIPWKYRDHAIFVCYAPAEDPSIAISVVMEHGGGGGSDAAPVARHILETYFGLPPSPLPLRRPGPLAAPASGLTERQHE
ncbi:MAG: penicillin-binding protein 2 [Desulfarculales bacterium]|jgi:penicillin-binding protein 2|nr:penicillin-binding protein 2 [Desulfarculales bacterium]